MSNSTYTIARDQPISNYEGDEVDHEDGDGDGDGDGVGLGGGVDGDSGGGMEKTSEADSGGVPPPSDLLRRQPSVSCFVVFVFLRRPPTKLIGGLFL